MKTITRIAGTYLLFGLIFYTTPTDLIAQVADTLELPEVSIHANRFDVADERLSTIIQRFNISQINESVSLTAGDILARSSRYVIRSYGPGQAQTAGAIGFNASQVKVLWNGIELNHPMLGLTDLSLIPAVLIDEISVDNHLGSSEYGSSAMGGTVLLESGSTAFNQTRVEASMGAYNAQNYAITTGIKHNKWAFRVGGSVVRQKNDFDFTDESESQMTRLNANKHQLTGLITTRYTDKNYWGDASVWLSSGESGAPGSITFSSTDARQVDTSIRFVHRSNWQHTSGIHSQVATTFNRMTLDYTDPAWEIESKSVVNTIGVAYSTRYRVIDGVQLRGKSGIDLSNIDSSDFTISGANRVFVQLNSLINVSDKLNLYPSVRYDRYSKFNDALSYGIGLNMAIKEQVFYVVANVNKNYAPPTFNDLYWPGFGNPELVPETSLKSDVGFKIQRNESSLSATYFLSSIQNGILWWTHESGRFGPNNVNELTSKGFTLNGSTSLQRGNFSVALSASWTSLESKYDLRAGDEIVRGNRVVYNPNHRVVTELQMKYKNSGLSLRHNYTGKRPVNEFNSLELSSIDLFHFTADHKIALMGIESVLFMTIRNLSDQSHQLIYDYPMPGRSWTGGIRLKL
jgi:vitamin B12 transporter